MSEKLFNLSKVICQHKYFKSSYGVDIYFCKICGIMRYLNVKVIFLTLGYYISSREIQISMRNRSSRVA